VKRALLAGICTAAFVAANGAFAQAGGEGAAAQQTTAPTNLHTTSEPTTHSVSVAWNPSTSPSGSVDYHVTMDNGVLTWDLGRNITSAVLTWGDDPGGTHTFAVWATDTFDRANASPRSNTISVTAATN
jgi:hypothetical protein